MRRASRSTGFTLIELLVVIAIIAILAAILFPVFAQARERARSASCLSNMKQFGLAIQMYKQDYDECVSGPFIYNGAWGDCNVLVWFPDLHMPYVKNRQLKVCPSGREYTTFAAPSTMDVPGTCGWGDAGNGQYYFSYKWNSIWAWPCSDPRSDWSWSKFGFKHYLSDGAVEDPAGTILLLDGSWPETWADCDADPIWNRQDVWWGAPAISYRHFDGFNSVHGDGHAKYHRKASTRWGDWSVQAGD